LFVNRPINQKDIQMPSNARDKDTNITAATATAEGQTATASVAAPTLSDFKAAFLHLRPQLEQRSAPTLTSFPLEGAYVVQTLLGVYQEIEQHHAAIVEELPRFDPQLFNDLHLAILALGHAEALKRAASGLPSDLEDPLQHVRTVRNTMRADLEPLVVRGLLAPDALTYTSGSSARSVAFDVLRFGTYMDQHARALQGRMWTTPEELEQARTKAQELLAFAGTKDQMSAEEGPASMYLRAMSHLAEIYEEVRWAVRYTRRRFGDGDDIAPSLYSMRAQRGVAKKPAQEGGAGAPTPASDAEESTGIDLNHLDAVMNGRPSDVVPRPDATMPATGFGAVAPEKTKIA
jgi:hypothetical protein